MAKKIPPAAGQHSVAEQATWKRRRGPRGGGRSERQKAGQGERSFRPERWENKKLPRAERVIAFLEGLPITKGILCGTQMKLLADQQAFVRRIYGETRDALIGVKSEPRGNGKTGLVAGLALCHLLGPEAEARGEIYSAAIDRPQAAIIFAEMSAIIHAVPSFAARCTIQRFHKKIEVLSGPGRGSTYEALSADARRGHGLAPSLWIYDELAQTKDSELLGNLRTSMGKRARSLGLVISTQAPDDEHALSRLIDQGLAGEDRAVVVHLTAAPLDADPFDPAVIRSVNPALGVFLDERVIFAEAAQARHNPLYESKFRNLRLNQRIDAREDRRLANPLAWRLLEHVIDLEAFAGRRCYAGLDLSATDDLTAFVAVFPTDDPEVSYDVAAWFWTPEDKLEDRTEEEQEHLRLWIRQGYVTAIPGPIVRYDYVARQIADVAARFELQGIAYDPWQIKSVKMELDYELPMQPFKQGNSPVMAPAIRYCDEVITTRRLRHGGNPALTASVLNAAILLDSNGNPKLDKSRRARGVKRIDGAVALVMALGFAQSAVSEYVTERTMSA